MHKKPRSTQKGRSSKADGHVEGPSVHDPHLAHAREVRRLSQLTVVRERTNPSPLAKRMTKFTQNMSGQVRIPRDIIHDGRAKRDGRLHLDVGQVPED